ncbi:MAG: hypothetical protein AB1689_13785 [Thermodesulfobacteriota bacterium]
MLPRGSILCALALVATLAGVASATEQNAFDRAIGKYAPTFEEVFDLDRPLRTKGLCVCTPGLEPGFLFRETGTGRIVCGIPVFNADGSFGDAAFPCFEYQILAR